MLKHEASERLVTLPWEERQQPLPGSTGGTENGHGSCSSFRAQGRCFSSEAAVSAQCPAEAGVRAARQRRSAAGLPSRWWRPAQHVRHLQTGTVPPCIISRISLRDT